MAIEGEQRQIINIILENIMKKSTVMKSKYKIDTEKSEEKRSDENIAIHAVQEETSIVEREVKTQKKCKRGRGQNILLPL